MKFSELTSKARMLWAKSGEAQGHGLLAHMLDVAAVTETLLEQESPATLSGAAHNFGLDQQELRWLAALAGLHDFGKAIPGFQAKWSEGMQLDRAQGLDFPTSSCGRDRHDLATAALLGKVLHERAGRVPRTRGDEPALISAGVNKGFVFPAHAGMNRPSRTRCRASAACSPHTRG